MSDIYCGWCGNHDSTKLPFCPYCSGDTDEPPGDILCHATHCIPAQKAEIDTAVAAMSDFTQRRLRAMLRLIYHTTTTRGREPGNE